MLLFFVAHVIASLVFMEYINIFVEYLDILNPSMISYNQFDFVIAILFLVGGIVSVLEILAAFSNSQHSCKYRLRDTLLVLRELLLIASLCFVVAFMIIYNFPLYYQTEVFGSWIIISWIIISVLGLFWSMGSCCICVSGNEEIESRTLLCGS